MAISAQDVKNLREATGAGMMDCKKALTECGGDYDAAVTWLREKGIAKAAKRADKVASEGAVSVHITEDNIGVLTEVNCETDFVARGDDFQALVDAVCQQIAKTAPEFVSPDETDAANEGNSLLTQPLHNNADKTLSDLIGELSGKCGEKLDVRRFARFHADGNDLSSYVHMNGKIGVLLEASSEGKPDSEALQQLLRDICLQICSTSPRWVSSDDVPKEALDAEKEVYKNQAKETGKPDNMLDKIAEGKLRKWFTEVCLLEQPFVKDSDKSIKKLLEEFGKESGGALKIVRFERFQLGEGIEKPVSNLADDVAAELAKAQAKE